MLTENSKSDDNPSKPAKFAEKDGFKILTKEAENTVGIDWGIKPSITVSNTKGVKNTKFK